MSLSLFAWYAPLSILCNTVLPVPFDPVLLAASTTGASPFALVGIGAAGAAIAASCDLRFLRLVRARVPAPYLRWIPEVKSAWFYVVVALFAMLPLPFSAVRAALLRRTASPVIYPLVVGLSRMPRYLATVWLSRSLALPSWVSLAILAVAVAVALVRRSLP